MALCVRSYGGPWKTVPQRGGIWAQGFSCCVQACLWYFQSYVAEAWFENSI